MSGVRISQPPPEKELIMEYEGWEKLFGREDVVVIMQNTEESYPLFAARVPPLGLTAYGGTKEEAMEKLKAMFASLVLVYSNISFMSNGDQ